MKMLVVGAGATGGYFGGRLALAGRDVSFLVRPARAAALRERGLQIIGPSGASTVTPVLVGAGESHEPADVILLTIKAYALASALDDIASQVGADTMIVPVLNGWRHVDAVKRRFGAACLVGGVCRISATLDAQGRVHQMSPGHDLVYGEMDGSSTARMAALDDFLKPGGFDSRLSATIDADMWEKWVLLATFGAANCLMRGSIGEIASQPAGRDFLAGLLDEASRISSAAGRPPRAGFLASTRDALGRTRSTMTTSMYRDLTGGSPVEADQIIGDLIDVGRSVDVPAPLLQLAYTHLSIYQARRPT